MERFLRKLIQHNFPADTISHAFGYGSAVFQQANYNIDKPNQVIDLIFIVNDTHEFHKGNFSFNYSHYSGIPKRLPLGVTSNFVNRIGSKFYFNPLIPLSKMKNTYDQSVTDSEFISELRKDQRKIKYGVIHKEDALKDLTEWNRFALAGRMQKPILTVIEDPEISKTQELNRDMALTLALLLTYHRRDVIDIFDIYHKICNFSFNGDIRMRWKMENPNKVRNIVQGSFEQFQHVYGPRLQKLEKSELLKIDYDENDEVGQIKSIKFTKLNMEKLQHMFD